MNQTEAKQRYLELWEQIIGSVDGIETIANTTGLTIGKVGHLRALRNRIAHPTQNTPVSTDDLILNLKLLEMVAGRLTGTGRLTAAGVPNHHLETFQLTNTGQNIRHRWFPSPTGEHQTGWSKWHNFLDGFPTPATDLAAATMGTNHIELFVLAADQQVWHIPWNSQDGWAPQWTPFEGTVTGPISAASLRHDHLEVYAFQHGTLVSRHRDTNPSWSHWTPL